MKKRAASAEPIVKQGDLASLKLRTPVERAAE